MSAVDEAVAILNAEIEKLTRARDQLLSGAGAPARATRQPSTNGRRKKSKMSPEARARIAEAQRKRWAAHRAAQSRATAPSGNTIEQEANAPAKRGRKKK